MPEWAEWVSASTVSAFRAEYMPDMPPLDNGYLLNILLEIGPVLSGGMGPVPITFCEINAWCNRLGIDLHPMESRMLIQLSREYASESHKATARDHPAPWRQDDSKPEPTPAQIAIRNLKNL